jgi:acyl-coenzyme A synthetase/AMP-(fatty) acid ligase
LFGTLERLPVGASTPRANIPVELVAQSSKQACLPAHLGQVLEVADYPRTPSGKVQKRLVREGIAVASG